MIQKSVWGGVSDPSSHSEEGFRYLIHAFNPLASPSMALINTIHAHAKHQRGEDHRIDPSHGDQTINLFEQPERVAQRVSLSMSLIDQAHTGTWGDGGIIVEVPEQNIIATGGQDIGSMNSDPDFLRQQFASSTRHNGDQLLQISSENLHNEVVAFANVDGSKIVLKGFFYKTDSKGEPVNEIVARKMQEHASRLGLPIVTVKAPGLFPKNEIHNKDNKLALHLDGNRCLLSGWGDKNFRLYDEKGHGYFISPEQMLSIISFMQTQGYNDNFTTALLADYQRANHEYFRAKFAFDDKGEIESVKKIEGYGKHQIEHVITACGYARIVDKASEMKKFQESMFGNGTRMTGYDDDNGYSPMNRDQAEKLIAEGSETLTEKDRQKVEEWACIIMPDLEQKSRQKYGRNVIKSIRDMMFSLISPNL
jgi:hypothetical protein